MAKISKVTLFTIVIFAIGFIIPALGFLFPEAFFASREQISRFLQNFGIWAPLIFMSLSVIPVVVTPLNHTIFALAGGFIFGPWVGFLLNWIAKIIGSLINFFVGRFLGKKVVFHLIKEQELTQYNTLFDKGRFVLFLMFSVPFLTNDTLSYLAGISSMKFSAFLFIIIFGHIGTTLSLAYLGGGFSLNDPIFISIIFAIALLALFHFYLKKKLPKK